MHDSHDASLHSASVSEMLHRAAARVDADLDRQLSTTADLTSRQYIILKTVAAHDGINQTGLTELTGIDRSTMTDIVGRLVRRGLLARDKKPDDARTYVVSLSADGRRHLQLALPIVSRINAALLGQIRIEPPRKFVETLLTICAL